MQITRLAPSPTGALHLGNARTFLINWLLARRGGWKILLRIEDLDGPRIKRDADAQAMEDLRWLGMDWDEGPIYQSSRMPAYRKAIDSLLARKLAYPCICTRKEAALAASAPHAEDGAGVYPGTCRGRFDSIGAAKSAAGGRDPAIRFAVPPEPIEFVDGFRGRVRFENPAKQLGDFVIAKADGTPAYQLAVVADDADMGITQIVRGDDLIDSTPRQIMLYHALNLSQYIPQYTHLPLVVGTDGRRLAKRHGDTRLAHYREPGVPAERVLSLLARWCAVDAPPLPSPGTPGEGRVRVLPEIHKRSSVAKEPSPQPSPGVPGEGGAEHSAGASPAIWMQHLLHQFDMQRIPRTPIIMSSQDEPRP